MVLSFILTDMHMSLLLLLLWFVSPYEGTERRSVSLMPFNGPTTRYANKGINEIYETEK